MNKKQITSTLTIDPLVVEALRRYARQYETPEFLDGDPSWFMHQVQDPHNQEAMAFLASCLRCGFRSAQDSRRCAQACPAGGNGHWHCRRDSLFRR